MEATSMSSCDGVSVMIGANVFAGFTNADGFLHMVSGGDGWLKSDVMSVGATASCLPAYGGHSMMYYRGWLAD